MTARDLDELMQRLQARHGRDGRDGHDGRDGADGQPGERGDRGPVAKHVWEGTALKVEQADGSWGELVDLKGERGEAGDPGRDGADGINGKDGVPGTDGKRGARGAAGKAGEPGPRGPMGPMPKHEWEDTSLRFELGRSTEGKSVWGQWVDLQGPPGKQGPMGFGGGGGGGGGEGGGGMSQTDADLRYLQLSGGTLTGALVLNANPVGALEAATKQYVDSHSGGGSGSANTILNGSGAPTGAVGEEGDFYIDTDVYDIYGPKTGAGWGAPTSLVGPQGEDGSTIHSGHGVPGTAHSLFSTQVPDNPNATDGTAYEMGMKFQVAAPGTITGIRFYRSPGESAGTHTGRIWSAGGTQLASVTFTGETASGWQEMPLSSPLAIAASTTYVVSVNVISNYPFTSLGLATSITNGAISSVDDDNNGVFGTSGTFPTTAVNQANYFRDILFLTDADAGLGVDGDFFLNLDTYDLYGPRTAGDWGDPASLIGPEGPEGPAGISAGKIFYLAPSDASDIATYKTLLPSPSAGAEQTIATVCTGVSVDFLVAVFATDPGVPGAVDYPAGTAYRRIYASTSSGTFRFHLLVYKRNAAGVETLVRDETSPDFSNQTVEVCDWAAAASAAGALLATDRIVGKLYAQRVTGGGGTITVTTYYEGTTHASQIQTTITAGPAGPGVPAGGASGQLLAKSSATDYDTAWINSPIASDVPSLPSGNLAASNVQAALNELQTDIDTRALASSAPGYAYKNALINANFAINQRGYVSGTATTGANQYTLDRWRVVTSGQNLTFSTLANGRQITAPAGGVEQVIESANVKGGTYALSWTGTATATVNGSAVTNGGTVVLTAATNATVRFSGGTVAYAQLELGSAATDFAPVPFEVELQRCQRYYEKSFTYSQAPTTGIGNAQRMTGSAWSTSNVRVPNSFEVPKRAAPTIITYAATTGAGAQWSFYNGSSYVAGTVAGMVSYERGFYCDVGGTATSLATYIVEGHWTADAEL